jgi:hypothetical protein
MACTFVTPGTAPVLENALDKHRHARQLIGQDP